MKNRDNCREITNTEAKISEDLSADSVRRRIRQGWLCVNLRNRRTGAGDCSRLIALMENVSIVVTVC